MAAHGRADIRADCKGVSEALGADVVFVTQSHPKQNPTEHFEAELELTAGVVVECGCYGCVQCGCECIV
jgi:hypothetical protein